MSVNERGLRAAFLLWIEFRSILLMPVGFAIRVALPSDVPVLRPLIDASVRRLQSQDYTQQQIESALRTVFGVDSQLIGDGTYLLVETAPAAPDGKHQPVIVACGGWSK